MQCFPLWLINHVQKALQTLVIFLSRCQGDHFGFAQLMLPLPLTLLCQAGWSRAKVSQVSTSISKIYSNALRQSYSALPLLSTLLAFPSLGEGCVRHSRRIFNTIRKNSD